MPVTSSTIIDHLRREHQNMLDLAQRFGTVRQLKEFEVIAHHFGSMDPHKLEAFIPSLLRKVEELKWDAVREAQDRRLPVRRRENVSTPGGIEPLYPQDYILDEGAL